MFNPASMVRSVVSHCFILNFLLNLIAFQTCIVLSGQAFLLITPSTLFAFLIFSPLCLLAVTKGFERLPLLVERCRCLLIKAPVNLKTKVINYYISSVACYYTNILYST